ncbi:peptidyl-prolyl cis-trans isomerase [Microbulbifer sp. GL-2]|uniref:peptidylprolyl isomerase n=1 Tax=Microbulbifer sp. GL-2 TaxID=2591606 RepID=UPI0011634919|nr:peptidylprolyl isomerase [Microbulbifer sp. GL-2]BBM00581.1 hypothetical protein GL2_06550 [Microbulbifer sp. GL-2]
MRALIKEPLIHMLIIGGLLFILDTLVQEQPSDRNKIVITEGHIEHLSAVFARRWQRTPSPDEVQQLVENYVREEILYREALNLGLDHNDTVIRRRLRMKMEFVARDLNNTLTPSDNTLQLYLDQNTHRYQHPAQFSFRQLYFPASSNTEDIKKSLSWLNQGVDYAASADSTLLPERISDESDVRIDQLFGPGFSAQLAKASLGKWSGPFESAYGWHLVFLKESQPPRAALLYEIRAEILRDWRLHERKTVLEQQYQQYRENYTVRIEPLSGNSDTVALK